MSNIAIVPNQSRDSGTDRDAEDCQFFDAGAHSFIRRNTVRRADRKR